MPSRSWCVVSGAVLAAHARQTLPEVMPEQRKKRAAFGLWAAAHPNKQAQGGESGSRRCSGETTPPVAIGSAPLPPPVKVFSARDLAPLPRPSGPDSRGCCPPPRRARGEPPLSRPLSRAAAAHWLPLSRSPRSFFFSLRLFLLCSFSFLLRRLGRFSFSFHLPPPLVRVCVCGFLFFPSLSGRRGSPLPSSRRVLLVDCCAAFTIVCRRGPTGCALLVVPARARARNFVCPRWWRAPPSFVGELLRQVRRRFATRARVVRSSRQNPPARSCSVPAIAGVTIVCACWRLRLPCASCRVADPRCGEIVPCAPVSESCVRVRDLRARPHHRWTPTALDYFRALATPPPPR